MQSTHTLNAKPALLIALELSCGCWKLAASDARRARPAIHNLREESPAARLQAVVECVAALKAKWELAPDVEVAVIYEAGQDGFWIARALRSHGWRVVVADAASIPVARQARRAKTDRLDALLLLESLQAWLRGETGRLRSVSTPDAAAEAQRQLARDRGVLQKEVGQHVDRIRKLLRTVGCWQPVEGDVLAQLRSDRLRCWDAQALPAQLDERLQREAQRLALVQQQLKELDAALVASLPQPTRERIAQLSHLKAVGPVGAMRLVLELYWRDFHNRRQLGACVGLVAQPYSSGDSVRDQGISKQGNRRVRALLIEMAWMWLRWQPQSDISRWFASRTGGNAANRRAKRIAIVAVARRLAIALWRYLQDGVIPQGAQLKVKAA